VLAELYRRSACSAATTSTTPTAPSKRWRARSRCAPTSCRRGCWTAELAGEVAAPRRALEHLRGAALIEPRRAETYHRDLSPWARKPMPPRSPSCGPAVTQALEVGDPIARCRCSRVSASKACPPRPPVAGGTWELLRFADRDPRVDDVMRALAPAVVRLRVEQLGGRRQAPRLPGEHAPGPVRTSHHQRGALGGLGGVSRPRYRAAEIYVFRRSRGGLHGAASATAASPSCGPRGPARADPRRAGLHGG